MDKLLPPKKALIPIVECTVRISREASNTEEIPSKYSSYCYSVQRYSSGHVDSPSSCNHPLLIARKFVTSSKFPTSNWQGLCRSDVMAFAVVIQQMSLLTERGVV
jgi:hypothetical protein